ncbi:MAG TPA: hypothetical protein VGM04_05720 [Sphingomicrobium sp.]
MRRSKEVWKTLVLLGRGGSPLGLPALLGSAFAIPGGFPAIRFSPAVVLSPILWLSTVVHGPNPSLNLSPA